MSTRSAGRVRLPVRSPTRPAATQTATLSAATGTFLGSTLSGLKLLNGGAMLNADLVLSAVAGIGNDTLYVGGVLTIPPSYRVRRVLRNRHSHCNRLNWRPCVPRRTDSDSANAGEMSMKVVRLLTLTLACC